MTAANITSLQYNSGTTTNPTWTTIPTTDYEVYTDEGMLYFYKHYAGKRNIKISYKAGYTTVPSDLEMAVTRIAARIYDKRKSEAVTRENVESVSIDWGSAITPEDKVIIESYTMKFLV